MTVTRRPLPPPGPEPGNAHEDFPENIPALEARLAALEAEEKLWSAYIKELSGFEDPENGVFCALELHEARQYRMVLRYRKDFCLARLRRLSGGQQ